MLAIFGLFGKGDQTLDITTSESLRDSQTNELLPRKNLRNDTVPKLFRSKVHNGGKADDGTCIEAITVTTLSVTATLLGDDHFMEVIELQTR